VEFSDEVNQLVARALTADADGPVLADAVRQSLELLARAYPGRAVEVRVPPYCVVQIMGGTTHRRGTPPAVVEMSAQTWLSLISGSLVWADGVSKGRIQASGIGSDLSSLF